MRVRPAWWIGVAVFLVYNGIVYAAWYVNDADYANMVGPDVALGSLFVPLLLGFVFLLVTLSWLRWWRPVMGEDRPGRPRWALWALLAIMFCFIGVNMASTDWSSFTANHLLLLIAAGVLVGFNEEALTRGILVVSWRGSTRSEIWVWFCTTLLFGLLHLPNWLFGLGPAAAIQVVFAFVAGTGFYVIRRVGGSLIIPMVLHGAWDFATFSHQASGAEIPEYRSLFQFGTYLLSLVLVILVLRADRRNVPAATGIE